MPTNSVSGSGSSAAGGGSADLQAAFGTAISSAKEVLQITTKGQADLNALRARPQ